MKENNNVSIILPAYNAEEYIAETILSVLNQTFENWELIIVNDGSKDQTVEIVSSFTDERIKFFEQENGGVSVARNTGLKYAKGKYITFLDADDLLPPDSLKSRVAYLEAHPQVDLVDGRVLGKDIEMKKDIRIYKPYYLGELLPRLVALDDKVFLGICYMFKSEILGDTRFKEKMTHAEDLLFYMELSSKHPVKYGFVPETIYWYRSGHTSTMTNLQGLEDGYFSLVNYVGKLPNISVIEKLVFRLKIAKIMFLSWLSQKEVGHALKSTFRLLLGVEKK